MNLFSEQSKLHPTDIGHHFNDVRLFKKHTKSQPTDLGHHFNEVNLL
jgi:hypothetical protein